MSIFVAGTSALEALSTPQWAGLASAERKQMAGAFARSRPCKRELEDALTRELAGIDRPVGLLIADDAARHGLDDAHFRVWRTPLPRRAFIATSRNGGVFLSAPEFAFVHAAWGTDIRKLIQLGFDICGSYQPSSHDVRGLWNRNPLATPASLARMAEALAGARGAKLARRAARYVLPGSASPMETAMVMLFHLPCNLGGFGIPAPRLNYVIPRPAKLAPRIDQRHLVCDAYWPEARLDVEYDSTSFHTGSDRIAHDSRRRDALALLGVGVITVTAAQVYDARAFENVAYLVSKKLGHRIRTDATRDWAARHRELRAILLGTTGFHGPVCDITGAHKYIGTTAYEATRQTTD